MASDFYGIDVEHGSPTAATSDVLAVVDYLRPKLAATPLIRIGAERDGAYLVPNDLMGIGACFSPGVNRIKFFEDHLVDAYGIRAHMCDFTCEVDDFTTPLRAGMQTFDKLWLDTVTGKDSITLDDWVAAHPAEGDLLLQMDIEGAEFRTLLATSDEVLRRFRVVVLELHGLERTLESSVLDRAIAPVVERLGRHFTSVHAHPNNCCGDVPVPGTDVRLPRVLELTLVRHDRHVPAAGPVPLPHPLDIGRNVPHKPPLFLSESWCGGPRPLESRLAVLEEQQRFRDERGSASAADEEWTSALALTMRSIETAARTRSRPRRRRGGATVEVAAGRPFRLSSARGRRVTGVVRTRRGYFFHTGFGPDQSIRIDLGRRRRLRRIELTNRTDAFPERARFLFVELSGRGRAAPRVFPLAGTARPLDDPWTDCSLDLPDVPARFVTITSPLKTVLHLSDVRVHAVDDDPRAGPGGSAPVRGPRLLGRLRRGPSRRR